jgi:predicted nuclease of predicted toxin-antitoxin system
MPDTATQTNPQTKTIKLFLDEDVWPGLAAALRERGFDVIHVYEAERGGLPDADQLGYAAQAGRAILTHNARDFVPLAVEWFFVGRTHAGVILTSQLEKGELVRRVGKLLQNVSAKEIANTVRFLSDYMY